MMSDSWLFWAVLAAVFAALTAVLAKTGVEGVSADFATFFRTGVVLAALFLLLTLAGQLHMPDAATGKTYLFLTLSGLATGASWLCYFRALKLGNASKVAPVDKLSVALVAIIATLFLGEKLSGVNWLGVAFVAAGAILVAMK